MKTKRFFPLFVLLTCSLSVSASTATKDSAGAHFNVLPIIITGGEWTTLVVMSNPGDTQASFKGSFYRDGAPWRVGITTEGNCNPCDPGTVWWFTLRPRASFRFEIAQTDSTEVGYLELYSIDAAAKSVTVYSILRNHNPLRAQDFEVSYQVAPLMDAGPKQITFDQMNYSQMVVNVTNTSEGNRTVTFKIHWSDEMTEILGQYDIGPHSVEIFNFAQMSQSTWNRFGLLQVDYGLLTVTGVTVTGHRINETGSFTPLVPFNY